MKQYAVVTVANNEITFFDSPQNVEAETDLLREYEVERLEHRVHVSALNWFGRDGHFSMTVSDVSKWDAVLAAHLAAAVLEEKRE